MKLLAVLVSVATLAVAAFAVQESADRGAQEFAPSQAGDHHAWLQQLVGEWSVVTEMRMAPGAEPSRMESTESVRAVGTLWIVAEGTADFGGGLSMTSLMTLGYDPREEAYVGNWVDSLTDFMWLYRGTLDDAGTILTLATRGPKFDDPAAMGDYRDVIEIVGPDHKRMRSSFRDDDGEWHEMMVADYRRRPAQKVR